MRTDNFLEHPKSKTCSSVTCRKPSETCPWRRRARPARRRAPPPRRCSSGSADARSSGPPPSNGTYAVLRHGRGTASSEKIDGRLRDRRTSPVAKRRPRTGRSGRSPSRYADGVGSPQLTSSMAGGRRLAEGGGLGRRQGRFRDGGSARPAAARRPSHGSDAWTLPNGEAPHCGRFVCGGLSVEDQGVLETSEHDWRRGGTGPARSPSPGPPSARHARAPSPAASTSLNRVRCPRFVSGAAVRDRLLPARSRCSAGSGPIQRQEGRRHACALRFLLNDPVDTSPLLVRPRHLRIALCHLSAPVLNGSSKVHLPVQTIRIHISAVNVSSFANENNILALGAIFTEILMSVVDCALNSSEFMLI